MGPLEESSESIPTHLPPFHNSPVLQKALALLPDIKAILMRAQSALQTVLSPIGGSSDSQTNGVDANLPPPYRLMRWLARSMTRSNGCCIVNNILLASLHLSWLIQVRCQQ
jgi:hypothetical protein